MKLISFLLLVVILAISGCAAAVMWLTKSAEQGNATAQFILGACYNEGIGVEKDEKEAVKWYTKSAEQGDAMAQCNLGRCFEKGIGVGKDEKEAVKWYTKAAEQGFAVAQYNLGGCYCIGRGVDKDEKEAVKWFTKSAEQADADAQFNLGFCYEHGVGVGKDEKEAVKWYTKAAEQGFACAQVNLGACYYQGTGVDKDERVAVKWWTKSAEQGLAVAQSNLGSLYKLSYGVIQDYKKAVKWYTKSAEQGFATAQYQLGVCYKEGSGVEKDDKEAARWFTKTSCLTLETKGSSDNYFIGLGSLETGNFTKAKQAFLLAGNRYGPTAENIRPEHMRLINSSDPCGASVLQILDKDGSIIGTGFFCDPKGWVLTAAHVVAGQEMITVRDGEMNTWQVEGLFPGEFCSDVVLMKTSAHPRNYAKLADTDSNVSDSVIQVGHPFGVLQQIVSEGRVENLNGNGGTWVCSMSAMPGNSGSPVFNHKWELVGITSKGSYFINSKKDSDPAHTWVVPLRELRKLFEAAKRVSFFQPVAMSKEWEKQSSFWNREEAKRARALLEARTLLYESYQDRDLQKAAAIIVTEAERGSSEAINLLGSITYQGDGVPKDPKKAFELWSGLAEQGDVHAQFNLGGCYYQGAGVDKDEKEAVKWWMKSAEQGDGMAQCNLGFCYEHGVGVGKDEKEAVRWYTKSAEQGFESAKKALEKFYSPVLVNMAELRDSKAQMVPGVLYYEDEGVTQEDLETKKLHEALKKSAEQGDARAQFKLGVDYFTGVGAIQDYKEAAKWWTKAAEQGDADAQYRLGMCYKNGKGVTKDEKEAVRWWTKSAEQGNESAKKALEKIKSH